MPRHHSNDLNPMHTHLPADQRRPSRDANREWFIDNYRVRRWYYRDAPQVGDTVRYMSDSFVEVIDHVTTTHVWFASGHAMRRPYLASRLVRWMQPRLLNLIARRKTSATSSATTPVRLPRSLRPDAATILV